MRRGGTTTTTAANKSRSSSSSPGRGLQTSQLLKFFTTSVWSGFDDTSSGFFTTFRTLFNLIASEELAWGSPYTYPMFGDSTSVYASTPSSQLTDIRQFYNAWMNFSTEKDFAWKDQYRVEDGMERRMKRLIEKENQRDRLAGKREYNDCVRNLVLFVRRRDPRYTSSLSSLDPSAYRARETARLKAELLLAAQERAKERDKVAETYKAQEWQRESKDPIGEWGERSGSERGGGGGTGDEDEDDDDENVEEEQWCVACGKGFRSGGAWENHERSRKHTKNLERLVKEMRLDDEQLGLNGVTAAKVGKDEEEREEEEREEEDEQEGIEEEVEDEEEVEEGGGEGNEDGDEEDRDEGVIEGREKEDKKPSSHQGTFSKTSSTAPTHLSKTDKKLAKNLARGLAGLKLGSDSNGFSALYSENSDKISSHPRGEEALNESEDGLHGVKDLNQSQIKHDDSDEDPYSTLGMAKKSQKSKKKGKRSGTPSFSSTPQSIPPSDMNYTDEQDDLIGLLPPSGKKSRRAAGKNKITPVAATTTALRDDNETLPVSAEAQAKETATDDDKSNELLGGGIEPAEGETSRAIEERDEAEMSKKDKRRAKEAAKKAAADGKGGGVEVFKCNVCSTSFQSRSKLFTHIKDTGHALAYSESGSGKVGNVNVNGLSKKNKR